MGSACTSAPLNRRPPAVSHSRHPRTRAAKFTSRWALLSHAPHSLERGPLLLNQRNSSFTRRRWGITRRSVTTLTHSPHSPPLPSLSVNPTGARGRACAGVRGPSAAARVRAQPARAALLHVPPRRERRGGPVRRRPAADAHQQWAHGRHGHLHHQGAARKNHHLDRELLPRRPNRYEKHTSPSFPLRASDTPSLSVLPSYLKCLSLDFVSSCVADSTRQSNSVTFTWLCLRAPKPGSDNSDQRRDSGPPRPRYLVIQAKRKEGCHVQVRPNLRSESMLDTEGLSTVSLDPSTSFRR